MVATSVGITARVLADLGVVHETESRIILGAAVVDDVLGLLILAMVGGFAGGEISVASIAILAITAVGFVMVVGAFGGRLVRRAAPRIEEARIPRTELVVALAVCLGLSALAGFVGLSRGIIDQQLYGVVVAMSILTTLVAPPLLKVLFAGRPRDERRVRGAPRSKEGRRHRRLNPSGGALSASDDGLKGSLLGRRAVSCRHSPLVCALPWATLSEESSLRCLVSSPA